MAGEKLTPKQQRFVDEYLTDLNATQAAIRAGYSEKTASVIASENLCKPNIAAAIEKSRQKTANKLEITRERVLQEAWGILTADVNDLVEYRRRCCRHCHGIDFGFQRTVQEMSRDRAEYENAKRKAIAKDAKAAAFYDDFDEKGGIGYDARLAPNPDCTECWGDGIGDAFFKPTADLSPAARALYAGVKQTKDGFQMLTIDKMGAMEKLFKHLNLYDAEIKAQTNPLTELLTAIAQRGGKLPIKPQE
jgi:phage terminase small subunit